jgi:Fur family ferric uptake transcriptional regulator
MGRREFQGETHDVLARYLAHKGLKSTRQRSLIVETFSQTTGHVSVDALLVRVRAIDPRVSAATVYRTMKLLAECGLADAQHFGDGQTRYETAAGRHHHDHLICTRCGVIIEFENDRIEALQVSVARMHGFKVMRHKMELYGICRTCQEAKH